jgi:hypothetical protein
MIRKLGMHNIVGCVIHLQRLEDILAQKVAVDHSAYPLDAVCLLKDVALASNQHRSTQAPVPGKLL